MRVEWRKKAVEFVKADITKMEVEAIVNPANTNLVMGGGVAGAIRKVGGREIEKEAVKMAPIGIGQVVKTSAGDLDAQYVLHVATMEMDFKTDYSIVRKCMENLLRLCNKEGISEVAVPALGAGVGGLDVGMVSKIMVQEVFKAIRLGYAPDRVIFVFYSDKDLEKGLTGYYYMEHLVSKIQEGPFLTVDAVIFDNLQQPLSVLLVERKNPPFGWALPGGFVDYGERVEDAVKREVKEETGLDFLNEKLVGVFSDPGRDERFHTVTVAFLGEYAGNLSAGSDAADVKWFDLEKLPDLAFDHRDIIEKAIGCIRG